MKTGHTQTFGRRTSCASLPASLRQLRGWAGRARACWPCCAAESPGRACRVPWRFRADEQRQWRALGVKPLSSGGSSGMQMVATDAVEPVDFVPARAVAPLGGSRACAKPAGRPQVRCEFAAGSATVSIGHCALLALRRGRSAISCCFGDRNRRRRSRAQRRLRHGSRANRDLLYAGSTARLVRTFGWCAGTRAAGANGSMPPTPTNRRRSQAGQCFRSRDTSLLISVIATIRFCTSRGFMRASTSARAGAVRSSPQATAKWSARAGPAAMAARSGSPMQANLSAVTAT